MNGRAEHKVPGGKLLRADLAVDETVRDIELHGDFFIYPEDAITRIEEALRGTSRSADQDSITETVQRAAANAELVGFAAEDVAQVVREAIDDAG